MYVFFTFPQALLTALIIKTCQPQVFPSLVILEVFECVCNSYFEVLANLKEI